MKKTIVYSTLMLAVLTGAVTASAVGLTVSPAIVTNDYAGKVTLNVSGLSGTRTVVVQRFGDSNHNGIVDAGEPLLQGFTVLDGEVTKIGGVRNLNVPGDDDGATNGAVRVELFFPGVDSALGRLEGDFLYRISNPSNSFTPVTASFTVRAKPQTQGITGRIVAAGSGLPVTNAFVLLLQANGAALGGSLQSSNGYYRLQAAPGAYDVWVGADNYFVNGSAGLVTVTSNQFTTNNIVMTLGTNTVAGSLRDRSSGAGLPGVALIAEGTNGAYALTLADASGNFRFQLSSGAWNISANEEQLPQLNCLRDGGQEVMTNLTGSVSNVILSAPRADALVFGFITDELTNGVSGLPVYSDDNASTYKASGVSYLTNGAYCLGLHAGIVNIGLDSDALAGLGYFDQSTSVMVNTGQAVRVDLVLHRATAHLIGRLVDETNGPVANLRLGAGDWNGNWLSVLTDAGGNFNLGVVAATWHVQLESNDAFDRGFIGPDYSVTVANGQTVSNLLVVVRHTTAEISGLVQSTSGLPLTGLGVGGYVTLAGTNYNCYVQTDGGGHYLAKVCAGSGQMWLDCNDLIGRGFICPESFFGVITGGTYTVNFTVQPFPTQPILSSGSWTPEGWFHLLGAVPPGHDYEIYGSTNLTDWDLIGSVNSMTGQLEFIDYDAPLYERRFYRVKML